MPSGPARAVRALGYALAVVAALALAARPGRPANNDSLPDSVTLASTAGGMLPASATPFRAGESLRFAIRWKFISAGTAWLEVPGTRVWNGRPAWDLVARAQSNGFIDKFYRVRNRIESVWDSTGEFSWRYNEDRHEGRYTANDTVTFEPDSLRMRYRDGRTYPVPGPVQDALSSFYYTRFQPLPIGHSLVFEYHASRKTSSLEVKVLGFQKVKVPAGTFDCIVVEPVLKVGGIFKNNGRLVIWLTADDRRIPVLMKSKVLIGSVDVALTDMKLGG